MAQARVSCTECHQQVASCSWTALFGFPVFKQEAHTRSKREAAVSLLSGLRHQWRLLIVPFICQRIFVPIEGNTEVFYIPSLLPLYLVFSFFPMAAQYSI